MSEQFNQCDGGHATKGEIRKYPTGVVGQLLLCHDCYLKHHHSEVEEGRPVYDWNTLEIIEKAIKPPKPTEAEAQTALVLLAERLDKIDWCGTSLDDAWADHVTGQFPEVLTEDEFNFFESADPDDREVLQKAINLIADSFVGFLGYVLATGEEDN
jgi:hypothetical protein